jgi:hypothetical protein
LFSVNYEEDTKVHLFPVVNGKSSLAVEF